MNPYLIDRILRSCRLKDLDVWYEIPLLRPFIKKIWKENILKRIKWKTNPKIYTRNSIELWGLKWLIYEYKQENKIVKIKIYYFKYRDYQYNITNITDLEMFFSNSTVINFSYNCGSRVHISTYYCGHKNTNSICIKHYYYWQTQDPDHIMIKDNGSNINVLKNEDCLCNKIPAPFDYLH
jgi:hypothetical protein